MEMAECLDDITRFEVFTAVNAPSHVLPAVTIDKPVWLISVSKHRILSIPVPGTEIRQIASRNGGATGERKQYPSYM